MSAPSSVRRMRAPPRASQRQRRGSLVLLQNPFASPETVIYVFRVLSSILLACWAYTLYRRALAEWNTRMRWYCRWWVWPAVLLGVTAIYLLVRWMSRVVELQKAAHSSKEENAEEEDVKETPETAEKEWDGASKQETEYRQQHALRWKEITKEPASPQSDGTRIECGVGFSGGGIRAAAYASGAAKGLLQTGVWPQIQYMSSVSGGGYITSAIALAHQKFREETQDFFYSRSLGAGYCFRQDGTIRQLVSSFWHFASRVLLAMMTNSVVMLLNLSWLTRLIDSALGRFLMSPEIQNPAPCAALMCIDRFRTAEHPQLKGMSYSWIVLSIVSLVMWTISGAVHGNLEAVEHQARKGTHKSRNTLKRIFPPAFACVKFSWFALTTLYFILAIAVIHRGDAVSLYIEIESGLVIIIGLVAIMTLIFSNLSHTAGYSITMFVLPLAGLMLVLALVFVCGLVVAARVHSHMLEVALPTSSAASNTAPSADLLQHVQDALVNATQTMHQQQAAANQAGEGFSSVASISAWLGGLSTFLSALWSETPWSAATWRQIDLCCSGFTLLLTLAYDKVHDVLTSVYRDGLAKSFHIPPDPHQPRPPPRTFSSLVDPTLNDHYRTPIWLCNAVMNDVSYAAGLMGQMAFSYCPFLFSPFGMGCQATGFGLFRRKLTVQRKDPHPAWADPAVEFGMSVSAAAMTPAMGPMQKMIPGARLIFNLAGANMGDPLPVRKPSSTVLWFIWLFAGMIFLADALPFTGENALVREWLPEVVLATSDHMRGWAWLFASFGLLSIPLYKIAGLPRSEDILHSHYIRMLFQSFGYVSEIELSGYSATKIPKTLIKPQPQPQHTQMATDDIASPVTGESEDESEDEHALLRRESSRLLYTPHGASTSHLPSMRDRRMHMTVVDVPSHHHLLQLQPIPYASKRFKCNICHKGHDGQEGQNGQDGPNGQAGQVGQVFHCRKCSYDACTVCARNLGIPVDLSAQEEGSASYGSPDFVMKPKVYGSVFPRLHAPNSGVSDGGHFENLGVFQLLLRRAPVILSFDAGDADLSFGRTWARYEDLVLLFSSGSRDWMYDHGVRIELTSIMAYSTYDVGRDPVPLFQSTDFHEALRIVESSEFNQPPARAEGIPESVLRKQSRCLVVRFQYLPLRQDSDAQVDGTPGILIYAKMQCLGLDAELTRIPDGPSLLGTAGWPLVPTSNQFLSQMTYIKYMLLGEQAAREAGILLKYHANHRLVDDMPTAQSQENPQPEPAAPTEEQDQQQEEEQKGDEAMTATPPLSSPDSAKRWEGSESPILSPANCAPPLDFPSAELEPLEGEEKDRPSQDGTEPASSLPEEEPLSPAMSPPGSILPDGVSKSQWPMQFHTPFLDETTAVDPKLCLEWTERQKQTRKILARLAQPLIDPRLILLGTVLVFPCCALLLLGAYWPIIWLSMLLTWIAYAFVNISATHAVAVKARAFEYESSKLAATVRVPRRWNSFSGWDSGWSSASAAVSSTEASKGDEARQEEPLIPYAFVYGVLLAGALVSITLPPAAQVADQLLPSTPLFNLTVPMPLLLADCESALAPIGCSVVRLEKTDPSHMHRLFRVGQEMGHHLWEIETNAAEYDVEQATKDWWKSVLAAKVEEAPLVCLHLHHPRINISASHISAKLSLEHPLRADDLCALSEEELLARARRLSPMLVHGFNYQMVQSEHQFGSHQISPLLFILLVAYLFGQAGLIARNDFYRRSRKRRKQREEREREKEREREAQQYRLQARTTSAPLRSLKPPRAGVRNSSERSRSEEEEITIDQNLEAYYAYIQTRQDEADAQDKWNILKLLAATLCLVFLIYPLDGTLHLLQLYYQRHSLVTTLSGDASGLLLLFHASSIATEYGLFLLQIATLIINIYRPRLRRDRTAESPLGHLVRLIGSVYTNSTAFCVPTYWIVRIQLEIDAAPSDSFWDYWNVAAAPPNFFSLHENVSHADVNLTPSGLLIAIRLLTPLLLIATVCVRICFLISEQNLWSAVRRGFRGAQQREIEQIRALVRNFSVLEKGEAATTSTPAEDSWPVGTSAAGASHPAGSRLRAMPPTFLEVIEGPTNTKPTSPRPIDTARSPFAGLLPNDEQDANGSGSSAVMMTPPGLNRSLLLQRIHST